MTDDPDTGRIGLVCFQLAMIAALLAASALVARSAHAGTATIGRTWPIIEPDALAEIEAKLASLPPDLAPRFGPRSNWTALQAASLGAARMARRRMVVPFYTLDTEIRLPDGRLLYPKGYSFNPLRYVALPQRLVIVHARELGWALRTAAPTDWILLAAGKDGGVSHPDPIALGEKIGRPLFLLEERVKQRLALTVAPVIVRQVGQTLVLDESPPDAGRPGAGR